MEKKKKRNRVDRKIKIVGQLEKKVKKVETMVSPKGNEQD